MLQRRAVTGLAATFAQLGEITKGLRAALQRVRKAASKQLPGLPKFESPTQIKLAIIATAEWLYVAKQMLEIIEVVSCGEILK